MGDIDMNFPCSKVEKQHINFHVSTLYLLYTSYLFFFVCVCVCLCE